MAPKFLLSFLVLAAPLCAQSPEKILIKAGRLVDVRAGRVLANREIFASLSLRFPGIGV